jgi:hypothetical protein
MRLVTTWLIPTTLVLDDATLVRKEATLVPFGELLYEWSTSYQQ